MSYTPYSCLAFGAVLRPVLGEVLETEIESDSIVGLGLRNAGDSRGHTRSVLILEDTWIEVDYGPEPIPDELLAKLKQDPAELEQRFRQALLQNLAEVRRQMVELGDDPRDIDSWWGEPVAHATDHPCGWILWTSVF